MTARQRRNQEEPESTVEEVNSTVDSEETDPDSEKTLYIGQCVGGPMDGEEGQSRFPKGFVLIDKPNSRAWVYDFEESTGVFTARSQDVHDMQRANHAAEGSDYDVRALERREVVFPE